ncbi:MAG TPA: hypothetical protein VFW92_10230, partial [Candidatus Limnocylindrales bacterium]|nr:hypothetical protein [Candidatus Limnocylindrales bacterium]
LFFHSFRGEAHYDEARALSILSRQPAATFLREARMIAEKHAHTATSAINVAEAIRDRYNLRLKRAIQLGAVKHIKRTYHRARAR